MSIFAYLAGGKRNSSDELRERLKWDALRARREPVDLGIPRTAPVDPGKSPALEDYDPVLRAHCRLGEKR